MDPEIGSGSKSKTSGCISSVVGPGLFGLVGGGIIQTFCGLSFSTHPADIRLRKLIDKYPKWGDLKMNTKKMEYLVVAIYVSNP